MAGIYIHIPFCKQACFYCDFHFSTSLKKKKELIEALKNELVIRKEEFKNKTVETIYFGGGTPSLLASEELESILKIIYAHYKVSQTPEVTLEANPDDIVLETASQSKSRLKAFKAAGINRLSIGVQSFVAKHLKEMNRAHSEADAKQCLELALEYFPNSTIDLIYGIPTLTDAQWNANLQIAFQFGVPHISSYALTVEPKTALKRFIQNGSYPKVTETHARKQFSILVEETNKAGFIHYETSNFGKPNYFSKHNSGYWLGKWYMGIGPSAHSFNGIQRSWNVSNNAKYIQAIQQNELPHTVEVLNSNDRYNEYVMTGLRTVWGVSLNKIESDFGDTFKTFILKESNKYIQSGLLALEDDNTIKTTDKGKFLADGIASELFMI